MLIIIMLAKTRAKFNFRYINPPLPARYLLREAKKSGPAIIWATFIFPVHFYFLVFSDYIFAMFLLLSYPYREGIPIVAHYGDPPRGNPHRDSLWVGGRFPS